MATKTITVTRAAYDALKSMKVPNESFSETVLRISRKRKLSEFAGILSKGTADRMEKAIKEARHKRNEAHKKRLKMIVEAFNSS